MSRNMNILFIATDDMRPELKCYGEEHIISPNIDKLAQEGVMFANAHCQVAVCNPSRASLLTGLRPDTLKVYDLRIHFRETMDEVTTLPQYLKEQGYHVQAVGKMFHDSFPDPQSWSVPLDYRYEQMQIYSDETMEWLEKENVRQKAEGLKIYSRAVPWEKPDVEDTDLIDGFQTEIAISKMAKLKSLDEPFFFGVGYFKPHMPFIAPQKYWDMYDGEAIPPAPNPFVPEGAPEVALNTMYEIRGYLKSSHYPTPFTGSLPEEDARELKHGYCACITYVDAQIGKLLKALEDNGLASNTVVIFWGDHGWKLGEHNSWGKMTNYEVDTRSPLIIYDPRQKGKTRTCENLVEFLDVFPTLCDLAGVDIPDQLEGHSLRPLMEGRETDWEETAFSQYTRVHNDVEYMGYAVRTPDYRYVEWRFVETGDVAFRELYDHRNDAQENRNVADDPGNAGTIKELEAILLRKSPRKPVEYGMGSNPTEETAILCISNESGGTLNCGIVGRRARRPNYKQLIPIPDEETVSIDAHVGEMYIVEGASGETVYRRILVEAGGTNVTIEPLARG